MYEQKVESTHRNFKAVAGTKGHVDNVARMKKMKRKTGKALHEVSHGPSMAIPSVKFSPVVTQPHS